MTDRLNNTTSMIVKKNLSNNWFIVSVVITILLIALLAWGMLHSSQTLKDFESKVLALEEASGKLLLYTKEMEMSVQMAAATGDLRWQETYIETKPKVTSVLDSIPELIDLNKITEKASELKLYQKKINDIENQAFDLVSQGNKEKASRLLSGWDYTKNQLKLNEATEELTGIMNNYSSDQIAVEEKLISLLLFSAFVSLIILVVSWFISIRNWQLSYRKIREKEDEITYLSYHDSLTGLYNRRYFEFELRRLNINQQLPIAIIISDADRLKVLNDTLGHNTGDELLIEIADILTTAVGDKGIVSRWGGDEFCTILPKTDAKGAEAIIALIDESCTNSHFEPETPSISNGLAIKTETSQDIDRTFVQAETRMYEAKIAKKSKV